MKIIKQKQTEMSVLRILSRFLKLLVYVTLCHKNECALPAIAVFYLPPILAHREKSKNVLELIQMVIC